MSSLVASEKIEKTNCIKLNLKLNIFNKEEEG